MDTVVTRRRGTTTTSARGTAAAGRGSARRPVAGPVLLAIGAAHVALGAARYRSTFRAMAADGLVDSVRRPAGSAVGSLERERAFWFEMTGVALVLLGGLATGVERDGHDLPRGAGWGVGATALAGGALVPKSGFWALLAPAALVLRPRRASVGAPAAGSTRRAVRGRAPAGSG